MSFSKSFQYPIPVENAISAPRVDPTSTGCERKTIFRGKMFYTGPSRTPCAGLGIILQSKQIGNRLNSIVGSPLSVSLGCIYWMSYFVPSLPFSNCHCAEELKWNCLQIKWIQREELSSGRTMGFALIGNGMCLEKRILNAQNMFEIHQICKKKLLSNL